LGGPRPRRLKRTVEPPDSPPPKVEGRDRKVNRDGKPNKTKEERDASVCRWVRGAPVTEKGKKNPTENRSKMWVMKAAGK